ncbi:MAG: O-antigen ligase family protein [Gaiellaceae bacterium]
MAIAEPLAATPRRILPILLVVGGLAVLLATMPLGANAALGGSVVMVAATAAALLESRSPFVTWANALGALVLVFWLIPMKTYGLPVNLPFQLEPYRLFLVFLFVGWIGALIVGKARFSAAGHGGPVAVLFFTALASLALNYRELADFGGSETEAIKPLTFFIGFLFTFMLVASTTRDLAAVDRLVRTLVGGATIVALAAIYEASTYYNVFDHLNEWLPFLEKQARDLDSARGGRLRVYASSQHPIALGCALVMMVPLAIYLAERARSTWRSRGWLLAAMALAVGSFGTISRTIVVMGLVSMAAWLVLRRQQIQRFWRLLPALPIVVHFVAPGALGGIWKAFFPKEGLVGSLGGRAGEAGSGRFADYGAARVLWEEGPIFGNGPGSLAYVAVEAERRMEEGLQVVTSASNLIFDNQFLTMLVEFGIVGVIALIWFSLGAVIKLGRAGKNDHSPAGDLMALCAISCAGFTASMFLYDAIAFIQVTLVFFVIAALGLRARELVREERGLSIPAERSTVGEGG